MLSYICHGVQVDVICHVICHGVLCHVICHLICHGSETKTIKVDICHAICHAAETICHWGLSCDMSSYMSWQ